MPLKRGPDGQLGVQMTGPASHNSDLSATGAASPPVIIQLQLSPSDGLLTSDIEDTISTPLSDDQIADDHLWGQLSAQMGQALHQALEHKLNAFVQSGHLDQALAQHGYHR